MSSGIESQLATIRTIDTNFLNINQESTEVKWDPSKKSPDVYILNAGDTAKLSTGATGYNAILGNKAYIPGTSQDTIKYKIHQGGVLHIGLASADRDLSTIEPGTNLASVTFETKDDTFISMSINKVDRTPPFNNTSTLDFDYGGKKSSLDISGYYGQTMYPWLSNNGDGERFSVSLSRVTVMRSFIRKDGAVIFTTVDSSGNSRPIIFDTGTSPTTFNNIGFAGGVPNFNFDIVETATVSNPSFSMQLRVKSPEDSSDNPSISISEIANLTAPGGLLSPNVLSPSTVLTLGTSVGAKITVDTAGGIATPASIDALSIKTNLVKPKTSGSSLELFEFSGKGITVEDVSGDVSIDSTLTVGNSATNNYSVMVSFGDSNLDKAMVVPSINNTSSIPSVNEVVGMIAYNNTTGKFVGYTGSGWVDLNV